MVTNLTPSILPKAYFDFQFQIPHYQRLIAHLCGTPNNSSLSTPKAYFQFQICIACYQWHLEASWSPLVVMRLSAYIHMWKVSNPSHIKRFAITIFFTLLAQGRAIPHPTNLNRTTKMKQSLKSWIPCYQCLSSHFSQIIQIPCYQRVVAFWGNLNVF